MTWNSVIQLFGGLALFLYGMTLMAEGMQKAAGDRLRKILEFLTSKPIVAVLTGAIATMLVQSSSATAVILVGFVNAGLMTLTQAVGTIFGANIGTTITAQLVSFNVSYLVYPAITIGGLLSLIGGRRIYRYIGQAIMGFGILFLGMNVMAESMEPLRQSQFFINMMVSFGRTPIFGVLIGTIFTGIIQSSSATTGIVIAMTMQGILSLPAALAITLGSNIGTCVTALLASIGTGLSARRAAVAHLLFNVVGVVIALFLFKPFINLVMLTGDTVTRQTANAHTLFNLINTMLFLPFLNQFVAVVSLVVPGEETTFEMGPKYLDKHLLLTPDIALSGVRQECLRMATLAREMVSEAMQYVINGDKKVVQHVQQKEDLVDSLEKEITVFLAEMAQHSLTKEQSTEMSALMHVVNDLERIGDHAQNLIQLGEQKSEDRLPFSEQALVQLTEMHQQVDEMLADSVTAFENNDILLAGHVVDQDDVVDNIERDLRKSHVNRINEQVCFPPSGVIFLDIISNLERIADHATNFAQVVLEDM